MSTMFREKHDFLGPILRYHSNFFVQIPLINEHLFCIYFVRLSIGNATKLCYLWMFSSLFLIWIASSITQEQKIIKKVTLRSNEHQKQFIVKINRVTMGRISYLFIIRIFISSFKSMGMLNHINNTKFRAAYSKKRRRRRGG